MNSICHISTTFIYKAGSCRRTYYILRELVKRGYQVSLIVGRDYEPAKDWDMSSIQVVQLPCLVKYVDLVNDYRAFLEIRKALLQLKPAIVHTHLAKAGVVGRLAAKVAGVPIILHTVHGPTYPKSIGSAKRLLYWFLEKVAGKVTDKFVFVGSELMREYVSSGVAREEKSVVIRTGRPSEDFYRVAVLSEKDLVLTRDELETPQSAFVMAYVARLVPSKAQDIAIRILRQVRSSGVNAYLWLIGEGLINEESSYYESLVRLVMEEDLTDYVKFAGFQTDVMRFIKASDIMIMTSRYEGLPNIAIEAGICCKPLIAFEVCGLSEVVEEGVTGLIFPQGELRQMSDAIIRLAQNKREIEGYGVRAREKLEREYSLEKMLRQKIDLYHSLISVNTP